MVIVHREPQFVLLPNKAWRCFLCVHGGLMVVTLPNSHQIELVFPIGWETDMTTTPRPLLPFLPQLGPHVPASACHDLALELWRCGKLTLNQSRQIGFIVLDSLPGVSGISRFSWKAGVLFKDKILRPLGL